MPVMVRIRPRPLDEYARKLYAKSNSLPLIADSSATSTGVTISKDSDNWPFSNDILISEGFNARIK